MLLLNVSKWQHTTETWADVLLLLILQCFFFPDIFCFFYYIPILTEWIKWIKWQSVHVYVSERCRTKWQIHKGLPLITQLYSSPELWGALESFQFILFVSVFIFLSLPLLKNLIPIIPSYFTELFQHQVNPRKSFKSKASNNSSTIPQHYYTITVLPWNTFFSERSLSSVAFRISS